MSVIVAPERSETQRREALVRANAVRSRRAELKRELKAGRVRFAALLLDPPECIETMKVFNLMLAVPKIGPTKATQILRLLSISPSKTVAGLSDRQRGALIQLLGRRA